MSSPADTITEYIVRPGHCIVISLLCVGSIFTQRSGLTPQSENAIEFEVARLAEQLSAEGFNCSDRILAGQAQTIETQLLTEPLTAYSLAVVTGRGGSAVTVRSIAVQGQGNKTFEIPLENTGFGAHAAIAVRAPGERRIQIRLEQKAAFRLLVCQMEASLYRMKQLKPDLVTESRR
ncbi:MAG: hypothetical protein ACOY5B_06985 [Spirochaetota bacterium]